MNKMNKWVKVAILALPSTTRIYPPSCPPPPHYTSVRCPDYTLPREQVLVMPTSTGTTAGMGMQMKMQQ